MALVLGMVCFLAMAWSWFGYPLALWLAARGRSSVLSSAMPQSTGEVDIAVVVVAYNEATCIRNKLENLLSIAWPSAHREVIVVSDCSTDDTDQIVREFQGQGVQLVVAPKRLGKDLCQQLGVERARASILVFTDATTDLTDSSLVAIAHGFSDETVGCVSGVDVPETHKDQVEGEGLYVRYEMLVRRAESALGVMIGASGCFFAVRRSICENWPGNLSSDLALPLTARLQGFRVVTEGEARCSYRVVSNPVAEFERKVRTIIHGMRVIWVFFPRFLRAKAWFLVFQVISHKVLRWSLPLLTLGILAACAHLAADSAFWRMMLSMQLLAWSGALLAVGIPSLSKLALFRALLYLAVVHASVLVAGIRLARGAHQVTWEPTRR
ncbi:MAG TPA: glycosyltransferase [Gemmatimonas sp.]|uniref:glycosyltransferase n=1 Tax=Gemmatimonas sp. TaxID=1962908 RepID=UPI002EDB9D55